MDDLMIEKANVLKLLEIYPWKWRYTKLLMLEKVFDERELFFSKFERLFTFHDFRDYDYVVHEEIKRGIIIDMIASVMQMAEDFAAFFIAFQDGNNICRQIFSHSTTKVDKFYRNTNNFSSQDIMTVFKYERKGFDVDKDIDHSILKINEYFKQVSRFWIDFKELYNKYKHGQFVLIRSFGELSKEDVKKEKNSRRGIIGIIDFSTAKDFFKREKKEPLIFLGIENNIIKKNLKKLFEQGNLLKISQLKEINVIDIIKVGWKLYILLYTVFFNNYAWAKENKFNIMFINEDKHGSKEVISTN